MWQAFGESKEGMGFLLYSFVAATLCITAVLVNRRRNVFMRRLKGPPTLSWLLGNEHLLLRQEQVGDLEHAWICEYGATFRISSCYGRQSFFTADPRVVQHIFHTSGYRYGKRVDHTQSTRNVMGRGIVWASGDVHKRHRKVMNPAFRTLELRGFLPLFQGVASRMTSAWKDQIQSGDNKINVTPWLARTALDAIGGAAFNYQFGALDNAQNELRMCLDNLFCDTLPSRPNWDVLFKALWRYIPLPILQLVEYMPTKEYRRFRQFRNVCRSVAKQLIIL